MTDDVPSELGIAVTKQKILSALGIFLLFIVAFSAFLYVTENENAFVQVKVVEAQSGDAVQGATVRVKVGDLLFSEQTSDTGTADFLTVPSGTNAQITVEKTGFELLQLEKRIEFTEDMQQVVLNFEKTASSVSPSQTRRSSVLFSAIGDEVYSFDADFAYELSSNKINFTDGDLKDLEDSIEEIKKTK